MASRSIGRKNQNESREIDREDALPLLVRERPGHRVDVVFDHVLEAARVEPEVASQSHPLVQHFVELVVEHAVVE